MEINSQIKAVRLDELKNKILEKVGSPGRDAYEQELEIEMIGEKLKQLGLERNLMQEELGKLIGVRRSQISRLERQADNVILGTVRKVALQADLWIELVKN